MQAVNSAGDPVWSLTLPPTPNSVRAARRFIVQAFQAMGADATSPADLLVSELTTNAVVHAKTKVRVSVSCHDHRFHVEVRDDDPQPPHLVEPDPLALRGRGMLLVDALADAWGVNGNDRGKTVWFELAS